MNSADDHQTGDPRPAEIWSRPLKLSSREIFQVEDGAAHYSVTFCLPVHLPLQSGRVFGVAVGADMCRAAFERVDAEAIHERTGIESVTNMEFPNDRHGQLIYSRGDVKVPVDLVVRLLPDDPQPSPTDQECYDTALNVALDIVNRVLIAYRHLASAHYIHPLALEELSQPAIMLGGWANLRGAKIQSSPDLIVARQPGDDSFHESLQDWLLSQRPVDVVRELQLNALDLLDQHQYRMAVIEARTSLEIAVDEALLSAMTAKGVEPRAASDILDCRPSLDATLRDVVDDAKIGKKLGRGCSEYLGINPLNTSLGPKWRRAKQLREDASHHGRIVNQHEAVEAVELMSEMISLIRASAARPA